MAATATRTCACGCGVPIPPGANARRKYATDKCAKRVSMRRYRRRKREEAGRPPVYGEKPTHDQSLRYIGRDESKDGRATARRGRGYDHFVKTEWPELLVTGEVTQSQALAQMPEDWPSHLPQPSQANVSRWTAAYVEDKANGIAQRDWAMDEDDEAALDSGYRAFVERFHPDVEVRWYDDEWEREIDSVVGGGDNLLLLAAQRHGKTQFLSLYCQRRISRDPNIRILWVSRTADLAAESVGFIRQLLEDENYAESVLGPGRSFKPAARGHSWTDAEFTVATRTKVMKAPTMRAIGIGATVSGRDADLIIIDDPQEREDIDAGATAGIKQKKWFFTTFMSRKMPHTGIAYITSRKHTQDIPGEIIENHAEDWKVLTYNGHDTACMKPEDDYGAHTDCVMWPSQRPFAHLMKLKRSDPVWFECNVQNNPTVARLTLITKERIQAATTVDVQPGHFPPGWQLIAGFDPASGKENAAVLWAYSKRAQKAQVVTAKKFRAGPAGMADALDEWHERFHCVQWVTETNWAGGFLEDVRVERLRLEHGLIISPHQTKRNKTDYSGGVTSMIQAVGSEEQPILLPHNNGSEDGQGIAALIGELLTYHPDANKHAKDDLVLAAWFPWWRTLKDVVGFRRAQREMVVGYAGFANPLGGI